MVHQSLGASVRNTRSFVRFREVSLTLEEQEELRKKEERKDKLHQANLRRKESGKQQKYDRRYNAKRKVESEAKKAALRA